jgi:hypothetical protein
MTSEKLARMTTPAARSDSPNPHISMPSANPQQFARTALRAFVLLAAFAALLAVASPAAAAESCGRKVIDDWYDDGRVDGTYPEHCYDDAIEALPRDVRDYSSAREDILRALQARLRDEDPPAATHDPSPGNTTETPPDDTPTTGTGTETRSSTPPGDDGPDGPEAAPPVDSESASSVPIPLLVLAGLALLLVAGGSAGYLIRRIQARRMPPPAA